MTFKNAAKSAIILQNSTLFLNNVDFADNKDNESGAAIFCNFGAVTVNNALFSNNYAPKGAAIYVARGELDIISSTFVNKNPVDWSLVYAERSTVGIQASIFENTTSKYATALYAEASNVNVINSKFSRLSANLTAGAIATKRATNLTVRNCEFDTVNSTKNGGAIFVDVNADQPVLSGTTIINATKFTNCYSGFGGAILQLGGNLYVIFSDFIKNRVENDGGAIYASNTTFYAGKDNFINNSVYDMVSRASGGALYIDYGEAEVELCNFTSNRAALGGAMLLYDSKYVVTNSISHDNVQFIYSLFTGVGSYWRDCDVGQDKVIVGIRNAPTINFEANKIVLNPIKIDASVSDKYFDLRNFNATTPVKNQGSMGACWAFGTAGALESAFKKATGITLDISEDNIKNFGLRYSIFGKPTLTEGGYLTSGLGYVLSWLGFVDTKYDAYDELGKISKYNFVDQNTYHVTDAVMVDSANQTAVKEALIKYGGLTIHVNGADPNSDFFNAKTNALYCNDKSLGNHFVTLVGWNDTYSASNFKINPGVDGAWICKNSWGTGWGDGGYFYLSYADAPFNDAFSIGYVINNTETYNKIYQHDFPAFDGFLTYSAVNNLSYVNTYNARGNDLIAAVGTYFENDKTDYIVNIYINGNLVYSQKGKSSYYGYETIKLNKPVAINYGDKFSAEIEVNTNRVPYLGDTRLYFDNERSVVNTAIGFEDLSDNGRTAVLKVYTLNNANNITGAKSYFSKGQTVIVCAIEGAAVSVSKFGKFLGMATVKNGEAKFNMSFEPGNYTVTTSFNDTEVISSLEVMRTIIALDDFKLTYNSDYTIDALFMDDDGKNITNATIIGFVDDKQVTLGITDENGTISFSPSDLKLSRGEHNVTLINPVTDENFTIEINVVSRFSSVKNMAMFYNDGSAFKVRVYDNVASPLEKGTKVVFKIKNKSYTRTTDAKGYVSFKIPNTVTPGKYTLKVSYKGETISKTVTVKQVIKAKKTVTVKKSAKKLVYKVTLKGKKVIKNKKVTLKVNGKTLKVKTNKKGVAQFTINKNIINKLKVGKKYTMKITYLKDTLKATLKVKR